MTKHFCDDCGVELEASWWTGAQWGTPDLDLCGRCYKRRCNQPVDGAAARVVLGAPQKSDQ